jgi:hypothetical protein
MVRFGSADPEAACHRRFAKRTDWSFDEKLTWLVKNGLIYQFKADVFWFLQQVYPPATEAARQSFLDAALQGPSGKAFASLEVRSRTYIIYNLLVWLSGAAFKRSTSKQLFQMMPDYSQLKRLGYSSTEETVRKYHKVSKLCNLMIRLVMAYTLSHEFGHLFMRSVPDENASELAKNEELADSIGGLMMWRLHETGGLDLMSSKDRVGIDVVSSIFAFHSWNLSKGLAETLSRMVVPSTAQDLSSALDRLQQIAERWARAYSIFKKAMPEKLCDAKNAPTTFELIWNSWSIPCAGLLLVMLRKRGWPGDLYETAKLLPRLADRSSKIYDILGKIPS